MTKAELARRLNISRQMIYKLMAKGMPIDSLKSAQVWRDHHLNQRRIKQWRAMLSEVRRKNRSWLMTENN